MQELTPKIVSEYDQEISQSQTAEKPWHREEEPHNNHEIPGRQTKQSNQLSLPKRGIKRDDIDLNKLITGILTIMNHFLTDFRDEKLYCISQVW